MYMSSSKFLTHHMPEEGNVHDFSIGEEEVQHVFFLYAFCKGADKELRAGTPCQGVDDDGRRGRGCWDLGGGRGLWFWGVCMVSGAVCTTFRPYGGKAQDKPEVRPAG